MPNAIDISLSFINILQVEVEFTYTGGVVSMALSQPSSAISVDLGNIGPKGDKGDKGDPGTGDMEKAIYDTNNDGVVDNAEKLGGIAATNYLKQNDSINGGYF